MRREISTIFKKEIILPEIVQEKANLAFEEIKNKEHDNMNNKVSQKSVPSQRNLFKKAPAWAAIVILAICVLVPTSIAVARRAYSLYQRMHQTSTEEWLQKCADYSAIPAATCGYSRELTEEEAARYEELLLKYQTTNISPKFQIRYANEENSVGEEGIESSGRREKSETGESRETGEMNGTGEGLHMRLEGTNLIIELPAAPLSDEHLLELIDFEEKTSYSMRRNNMVNAVGGLTVFKKLEELTQEDMERYYLIYYGANLHTSGGYSRRLSAEEKARFAELTAAYEAGTAYPQVEVAYIDKPEQFTGEQVAFCLADERYYLPEDTLSDEELLQIIDLDKKAYYSILQLNEQYIMGEREHMPRRE